MGLHRDPLVSRLGHRPSPGIAPALLDSKGMYHFMAFSRAAALSQMPRDPPLEVKLEWDLHEIRSFRIPRATDDRGSAGHSGRRRAARRTHSGRRAESGSDHGLSIGPAVASG